MTSTAWPLFDLRIRTPELTLRLVRENDLAHLAATLPDDYEHDPHAEMLPGLDLQQHRTRLVYQGYWRSLGTWSSESWCLDLAVVYQGSVVGVQSLEAQDFPTLRTVESGSWLDKSVRGRGIGAAMRRAALAPPRGAHRLRFPARLRELVARGLWCRA